MPASHAKAEGAEVQHLTWLDNESEVHLGYMRAYSSTQKCLRGFNFASAKISKTFVLESKDFILPSVQCCSAAEAVFSTTSGEST